MAAQDRDLRFIWAYNQRTRTTADVVGKTDNDLFPEDAETLKAWKRGVLESGVERREQVWLTSNGARLFLDLCIEPIFDGQRQVVGIGVATVDLTKQKLAEQAVLESEKRLSTVLRAAPIAISLSSLPEGKFYDVNQAWLDLTGIASRDEVIGKTSIELGLTPDGAARGGTLGDFGIAGSSHGREITFRARSGGQRTVLVNVEHIDIGGKAFMLTTNHNIAGAHGART